MADINVPSVTDIILPTKIQIPKNLHTSIRLRSETSQGLAYKIKTTKPRQYVVEPSLGVLLPFQEIEIDVKMILQKHEDLSVIEKEDHRFKIEIFRFDWRKTVDDLKKYLKETNVKGLEKKIEVECVKENIAEDTNTMMEYVYYGFVLLVFVDLVKKMIL
ncbi:hypothetical protein BDAP_000039 [Binucleata daphniae]